MSEETRTKKNGQPLKGDATPLSADSFNKEPAYQDKWCIGCFCCHFILILLIGIWCIAFPPAPTVTKAEVAWKPNCTNFTDGDIYKNCSHIKNETSTAFKNCTNGTVYCKANVKCSTITNVKSKESIGCPANASADVNATADIKLLEAADLDDMVVVVGHTPAFKWVDSLTIVTRKWSTDSVIGELVFYQDTTHWTGKGASEIVQGNHLLQNAPGASAKATFNPLNRLLVAMFVMCGAGLLFSFGWLSAFQTCPGTLIWGCFLIVITMNILSALSLLYSGSVAGAILGALSLAGIAVYICLAIPRIPLAKVFLSAGGLFVQKNRGLVTVAYQCLVLVTLWCIFWTFGATAAYYSYGAFMYIIFVFSYYWVSEVLRNILHVTCCSTYAMHYFAFEDADVKEGGDSCCSCCASEGKVSAAWKRATGPHFGSICFGSGLVALIKTIKFLAEATEQRGTEEKPLTDNQKAWNKCLMCVLNTLESWLELLNEYAYVQVAIFGKPFTTAAKDTFALMFSSDGCNLLVNDSLTDAVLNFACLGSGMGVGIVGAIVTLVLLSGTGAQSVGVWAFLMFIVGLLVGYVMTRQVIQPVDSVIATCFVCYASNKEQLSRVEPELYNKLGERLAVLNGTEFTPVSHSDV